jgi:hypothetical protein
VRTGLPLAYRTDLNLPKPSLIIASNPPPPPILTTKKASRSLQNTRKRSANYTGLGRYQNFSSKHANHLSDTIINRILAYKTLERKHSNRVGKPKKLTDTQVDVIIKYCSESYEHCCLDYDYLVLELKLDLTASTL